MNTQAKCAAMNYPGCTERLRKQGFPSLARMAEILPSPRAIDQALGYDSAASHWLSGRNNMRPAAEKAAALWLQVNDEAPKPHVKLKDEAPRAPDTPSKPVGTMLLVVTDQPDRVRRVLAMLGAEVEEV